MSIPSRQSGPQTYDHDHNLLEMDFVKLLSIWHSIAMKYNITYTITDGTLLGYRRSRSFITHDDDVDIMIDVNGISKLYNILDNKNESSCIYNRYELLTHTFFEYQKNCILRYNNQLFTNFMLLINEEHSQNIKINDRTRYSCFKKRTIDARFEETDPCSFTGAFAKLFIYSHYKQDVVVYLDIFTYFDAKILGNQTQYQSLKKNGWIDGCGTWGHGAHHDAFVNATRCGNMIDSLVQIFDFQIGECYLSLNDYSKIVTMCPKHQNDIDRLLESYYGSNWQIPQ